MLTRIRNALIAKHDEVDIPASKTKKAIADILLEEGYIAGVENSDEGTIKSKIKITLKYSKHGKVISGLRRISKPGLRVCTERGYAQGSQRGGHSHRIHLEGDYDGQAGAQRKSRRRSAGLRLVMGGIRNCQE